MTLRTLAAVLVVASVVTVDAQAWRHRSGQTPIVTPIRAGAGPAVQLRPASAHRVQYFGYWKDNRHETAGHSNTVDVSWPTTDLELAAVQTTLNQAWSDDRWFVVWVPFIFYGPTPRTGMAGPGGYIWLDKGEQAWHRYVEPMRPYLPRVIAFYLMDEPDTVASGDAPASGYDPNLYNPLIERSLAVIRADYPGAPVALNYAFANRPGLVIPSGLTWVGLETYGVTLPDDNLRGLVARLTRDQGVMLMPKAYIDLSVPGEIDDAQIAAFAQAQADYAVRDPRIIGLRPFLWCVEWLANCDDVAQPTDLFYSVGGSKLLLTQAAFRSIGHAILGR